MERAWAYSPVVRIVETSLRAAAYATALLMAGYLANGTLAGGHPPGALQLIQPMALGALLPYAAALIVRRSRRVPLDNLAGATSRPWRLPLPAPGFHVTLPGGPSRDLLLPPEAAGERDEALGRYARRWPWPSARALALKFGLFPLVPTLTVFRVSQVIGYGGFFGEYQWYGLARWATNLAVHWAVTMTVLTCWAAVWRAAAEATSLLGAIIGPRAAHRSRRGAEIAAAVAYYAGVPAALAVMFLR
ncbi:MAG TPA: hypothetical protein VIG99_22990 [Myxococcaceae bacterium]|jgi:apolipoprotein N-acyltransferase